MIGEPIISVIMVTIGFRQCFKRAEMDFRRQSAAVPARVHDQSVTSGLQIQTSMR